MGYDNTNKGAIWANSKKETETHPDFTGSINVEGKDYWVSGWKRKEGAHEKAPALSFSIKLKDQADNQRKPAQKANVAKATFDPFEDIPFN